MSRNRTLAVSAALALTALAPAALAQSRDSFLIADDFVGITMIELDSTTQRVDLTADPKLIYLGVTYSINSVLGVWALSDFETDFASTTSFGVWNAHKNLSGTGGIAGWKTNPNTGLTPSTGESYAFNSLNRAETSGWGFHIRVNGTLPTGGNTAYFTVPTPGTSALFGLGAALITRRKRPVR